MAGRESTQTRAGARIERLVLLLLCLWGCVSLAALVQMSLESMRQYHWLLTGVCLGMFALTVFLTLRTLRDRFELLSRLESHTRLMSQGDFSQRVRVRQDDEFKSLGAALNDMTSQLEASIRSSQSVADIDRLILDAADLETVVRKVLLSAHMDNVDVALLLRPKRGDLKHISYRLESRQLQRQHVRLRNLSSDSLLDIDGYQRLARQVYGESVSSCLPVAPEGQLSGVLVACSKRAIASTELKQLAELADRLAVAMTNIHRSEVLFQKAHFDDLTGLINRHAFQDKLKEQISRSWRGEKGAVLFIDLDGFKKVNDTEGHKAGDRLLVVISERLKECLREVDTIARLGGDEFAVIVPGCDGEKSVSHLCERIIAALVKPIVVARMEHTVGASIGVALFPDDGQKEDELVMKADSAMYRAKETGRARFAFFDDTLNEANRHRVLVESRLRRALKQGELELHFQPKLRLSDRKVTSAEALLRWTDSELGQVSPEVFVPIAEETNLIHEFTAIQVDRTADLFAAADSIGLHLDHIAINASAKQLMTDGFAISLLSMLDRRALAHHRIEIEVTESVFAHDKQTVVQELEILQHAGIKIALDDFGTGFSSLNMLRELPLDVVKIDRSFITEIENSDQARVLVRHLISIATTLGKEVVAEGVETEVQLAHLENANCHYVQGFLISKARTLEDFLHLVADWEETAVAAQEGLHKRDGNEGRAQLTLV
ncbi:MAG: EAL domain-containing protein [Pseudomonadales bacterium]|nr:EAL domain-containing protein [Pseudomonadales bacterium]